MDKFVFDHLDLSSLIIVQIFFLILKILRSKYILVNTYQEENRLGLSFIGEELWNFIGWIIQ